MTRPVWVLCALLGWGIGYPAAHFVGLSPEPAMFFGAAFGIVWAALRMPDREATR